MALIKSFERPGGGHISRWRGSGPAIGMGAVVKPPARTVVAGRDDGGDDGGGWTQFRPKSGRRSWP